MVYNRSTTCSSSPTHDDECVTTHEGTVSPYQMQTDRPQHVLEHNDKDTTLKDQMLTDRHIMMAQSRLKVQFPEIDGLLSLTLMDQRTVSTNS